MASSDPAPLLLLPLPEPAPAPKAMPKPSPTVIDSVLGMLRSDQAFIHGAFRAGNSEHATPPRQTMPPQGQQHHHHHHHNRPGEIMKRLQRETFPGVMRLMDKHEQIERILSMYRNDKGFHFPDLPVRAKVALEAVGALLLIDDEEFDHAREILGVAVPFLPVHTSDALGAAERRRRRSAVLVALGEVVLVDVEHLGEVGGVRVHHGRVGRAAEHGLDEELERAVRRPLTPSTRRPARPLLLRRHAGRRRHAPAPSRAFPCCPRRQPASSASSTRTSLEALDSAACRTPSMG